jgi:hypothetical protein
MLDLVGVLLFTFALMFWIVGWPYAASASGATAVAVALVMAWRWRWRP